jgi:hypothetical protein
VAREDLAGVEGNDRDLVRVDDGEDPPAGVGRASVIVQPDVTRATSGRRPSGVRRALAWDTRAPFDACGFSHEQPNGRGPHQSANPIGNES